jgi:translation initiation factor eIF-2B subunit beta
MANGGILGTSGCLLVALAAKAHLVPMIVVGGIYKLTPKIPFEQDTYNDLINPGAVFKPDSEEKMENIDVIVPGFDYISPEYVTLYITNLGEHTPAYIYRVFSEYYVNQ